MTTGKAASAGNEFWIVSCSASGGSRDAVYSILRSRVQSFVYDSGIFEVPTDLKFGSFDDLIRLADDLAKHDDMCEQVVRRVERQSLDLDANAELRVQLQRDFIPLEEYLHRFKWDDSRWPRSRGMKENIDALLATVARTDEDVRSKTALYNDTKQHQSSEAKRSALNFIQRDLLEVLTPENVNEADFPITTNLTTAIAVVPRGMEDMWQNIYESLDPFVVPRSTKKFSPVDKEGNTLWRIIVMKRVLSDVVIKARAKRFAIREFVYDPNAVSAKALERAKIDSEKSKQEAFLTRICSAAMSDTLSAWIHLKAMRIFVESVLRYGLPPDFAAFMMKPVESKAKRLRKELADVFTSKGVFGRAFVEDVGSNMPAMGAEDIALGGGASKEYYPYASVSFVPFQLYTKK